MISMMLGIFNGSSQGFLVPNSYHEMSLVVNAAHDSVFFSLHISGPCDECSPEKTEVGKT